MSDLSKCIGKNCELKKFCYRYTAPENPFWQSYTEFEKYLKKKKGKIFCFHFIDNNKK